MENNAEPVYIFGHRNPDADAICSAIGYAAYKTACGEKDFIAARCGNSNARIDTILETFKEPLPRFIGDVTPRVRDIMVTDVHKVQRDAISMEALELFDRYDVRTLPVVDKDNRLEGLLSIFDLGDHFIPKPNQERSMRRVFASISDIVRALKAKVIHTVDEDKLEDLFVRIGAMDIRSFGHYYVNDAKLASSSIIIVGDRYDIQQRSIQSGVRMIVISGNLPVDEDVIAMAKERGVSLIVSPEDSATTSWIIRSAGRVEPLCQKEVMTFSPDEKLYSVKKRIAVSRAAAFMVVDEDKRLLGVFTKTDLLKPIRTKIILVDHNELSQAVAGADKVQILEIVDHHRLGNPPTSQPIFFLNAPLGSTSTLVADLFQKAELRPPASIAGVLMGGIISDTLNLKGPTTTDRDRELLSWLADIAGITANELAGKIFNAGSIIQSEKPEAVIRADMKVYNEDDISYSVSQVEELGFDNLWKHRDALEEALNKVQKEESLAFSALLVTDINTQNSILIAAGDQTIIDRITYPQRDASDVFELNGIVSRKKQLIPYFASLLRGWSQEG
jgi:manganese-dependent inorganic pyrophosphatase